MAKFGPDDRIFKVLLMYPDSKPVLKDIISCAIMRRVADAVFVNSELPASGMGKSRSALT